MMSDKLQTGRIQPVAVLSLIVVGVLLGLLLSPLTPMIRGECPRCPTVGTKDTPTEKCPSCTSTEKACPACPKCPKPEKSSDSSPYTEADFQTQRSLILQNVFLTSRFGYKCELISAIGGNVAYLETGEVAQLGAEGSWPLCLDFAPKDKQPCTVLSFGINHDYSFDDAFFDRYGCKVYSFDPSMGVQSHTREKGQFIAEGLHGTKGDSMTGPDGRKINWKVDTLAGYIQRFNVDTIDYLKIDIEYSEWSALKKALDDGSLSKVKQLGFEVHFWPLVGVKNQLQEMELWLAVMEGVWDAGFRMWYSHTNPMSSLETFDTGMKIPCCFEMVFVNINYQ